LVELIAVATDIHALIVAECFPGRAGAATVGGTDLAARATAAGAVDSAALPAETAAGEEAAAAIIELRAPALTRIVGARLRWRAGTATTCPVGAGLTATATGDALVAWTADFALRRVAVATIEHAVAAVPQYTTGPDLRVAHFGRTLVGAQPILAGASIATGDEILVRDRVIETGGFLAGSDRARIVVLALLVVRATVFDRGRNAGFVLAGGGTAVHGGAGIAPVPAGRGIAVTDTAARAGVEAIVAGDIALVGGTGGAAVGRLRTIVTGAAAAVRATHDAIAPRGATTFVVDSATATRLGGIALAADQGDATVIGKLTAGGSRVLAGPSIAGDDALAVLTG
jgi:hypothetical protein